MIFYSKLSKLWKKRGWRKSLWQNVSLWHFGIVTSQCDIVAEDQWHCDCCSFWLAPRSAAVTSDEGEERNSKNYTFSLGSSRKESLTFSTFHCALWEFGQFHKYFLSIFCPVQKIVLYIFSYTILQNSASSTHWLSSPLFPCLPFACLSRIDNISSYIHCTMCTLSS